MGAWDFGAGGINALANIYATHLTNKANIKMERETRQWNKKMWDAQNYYNHPTRQMARLQEAGLNPRLIYGNSPSGASGFAGSVPAGKAPQQSYSFGDPIGAYLSSKQTTAMTGLNDALNKKAQSETAINFAKLGGVKADTAVKMATTAAQIQQIRDNANIASQDFLTKQLEYNTLSATQQGRIEQVYQDLDNTIARKSLILSNINVNEKQLEKMTSDIELNRIRGANYDALTGTQQIIRQIQDEVLKQEKYWTGVLPLGKGDSGTILFAEMLDDIGQSLGASGIPYAPQIAKIVEWTANWWSKKKKKSTTTTESMTIKQKGVQQTTTRTINN